MLRIFNLRGRTGAMRKRHFSPIPLVEVAHRQAKGEHFSQYDNRGRWQLSTGVGCKLQRLLLTFVKGII